MLERPMASWKVGMSNCQGCYDWNRRSLLKVANFAWVLGGFGVNWCQVNSNMFRRFCFDQIACRQKCHVSCRCWLEISLFGPDFGSKTACLCTVGPIGDFPFFGVKFLMCPSKIVLQIFVFLSHSSRWLGHFLLSWVLRSTPHFMDFWWDRFHWFDWLHCAYWLLSVRSFDVVLWFLDVEIGGKKRRKVPSIQ